jgi:anti-sigma B factor antagonist
MMEVHVDPHCADLRLAGRLDVTTVGGVRTALHAAIAGGAGDLMVSLADVEMVDATGLGVLVGAHRQARAVGRRLVLRELPPRISRVLTTTHLYRVLNIAAN